MSKSRSCLTPEVKVFIGWSLRANVAIYAAKDITLFCKPKLDQIGSISNGLWPKMSVSHVLKRKLQIRVHRTWSTDHNRNQTIKNWSILKSWVFSMNFVQHLYTLLGRHLLPLRLSHSLCSYVGELAPDIKSPCPSISSVCQTQHVPKDVMKMSSVNQVFSRRPRTRDTYQAQK